MSVEERWFGATYSTDSWNFGEITSVFEVSSDWDGWRYHGYCWCPPDLIPLD